MHRLIRSILRTSVLNTTRLLPLASATVTQKRDKRAQATPGLAGGTGPLGRRIDADTRRLAVAAIGGYQRYLSPHKRFACAHRLLHGGESCSQYVKCAIAQQGLSAALPLARQRFQDCRTARFTLKARQALNKVKAEAENETEAEAEQEPSAKKRRHDQSEDDWAAVCMDVGCEFLTWQDRKKNHLPDWGDCWPDCSLDDCDLADCDLTNWGDADCGSAGDCDPGDCGSGADCGSCDFG